MRVKARWNQKDRPRSLEENAGVVGFNIWKIAGEALLNLENEGFETETHAQRLDVMAEFVAFLVHIVDRMTYSKLDDEQRQVFVSALARHLIETMQSNRIDAQGEGDYTQAFIEVINSRVEDYSECSYTQADGPSFTMRRILGDKVMQKMGEKDNKWIPDYVIDAEVPKAMTTLKRAVKGAMGKYLKKSN